MAQQWISLKDCSPVYNGTGRDNRYIVWIEDDPMVHASWAETGEWNGGCFMEDCPNPDWGADPIENVTHWMPFPEGPKD